MQPQPQYLPSASQYIAQVAMPSYVQSPFYPFYPQPQSSASVFAYAPSPNMQSSYTSQPTILQGMSPYNPSMLISQSNELYNRHQNQQLSYYDPKVQQSNDYLSYYNVASSLPSKNQYLDEAEPMQQMIQNLHAAATQIQYSNPSSIVQIDDNKSIQGFNDYEQMESYKNMKEQVSDFNDVNNADQQNWPDINLQHQLPIKFNHAEYDDINNEETPNRNAHNYHNYNQEILRNEATLTPQSAYEQHMLALNELLSTGSDKTGSGEKLRIYVPDDHQEASSEVWLSVPKN